MANFWEEVSNFVSGVPGAPGYNERRTASAWRERSAARNYSGTFNTVSNTFLAGLPSQGLSDNQVAAIAAGEIMPPGVSPGSVGYKDPASYLATMQNRVGEATKGSRESVASVADAQKLAPGRRQTMLGRSGSPNTLLTLLADNTTNSSANQPITLAKMRGY